MINLLPPAHKEQVAYAKRNAIVLHYLRLMIVVIIILAASFMTTQIYIDRQVKNIDQALEEKQAVIRSFASTQKSVRALNDRVAAIKAIQAAQPRFSLLLSDIAKFTLKGTAITSLALTGEDSKPVIITASANSYNNAVSLRDALAASPRISAADIQNVLADGNGYKVTIIIGFKPGQAR